MAIWKKEPAKHHARGALFRKRYRTGGSRCAIAFIKNAKTHQGGRMKTGILLLAALLVTLWTQATSVFAGAASSAALVKAKQDAEAKGYIFFSSVDEIVAQAKKEGRLRILSGEDPSVIKATAEAFQKKYPFIDARPEG